MADLKISQLPETTSLIASDIVPVVNGGLTKRISFQNLNNTLPITTFVQNASSFWGAGGSGGGLATAQYAFTGPYIGGAGNDNLTNNTDNYPRWNTEVYNTSTSTFELLNPGTIQSRVFIKAPGYYQISANVKYFDLYNNMTFHVSLFNSATPTGAMAFVTRLSSRWYVGATLPGSQTQDSTTIFFVAAPGYYTVSVFPTANSPFPADNGSTPSRFTLLRLLPG